LRRRQFGATAREFLRVLFAPARCLVPLGLGGRLACGCGGRAGSRLNAQACKLGAPGLFNSSHYFSLSVPRSLLTCSNAVREESLFAGSQIIGIGKIQKFGYHIS
jgi:hypothetical protein